MSPSLCALLGTIIHSHRTFNHTLTPRQSPADTVRVFQLCFARAVAESRAPLLADFVATLRHQFGLMPVRLLPDQIGSSATPSLAALGHGSGSLGDLGAAGLKSPTSAAAAAAAAAQEAASVRLVSVAHLPAFGISPEAASHEALGMCPPTCQPPTNTTSEHPCPIFKPSLTFSICMCLWPLSMIYLVCAFTPFRIV
jgi:hypothetical protein